MEKKLKMKINYSYIYFKSKLKYYERIEITSYINSKYLMQNQLNQKHNFNNLIIKSVEDLCICMFQMKLNIDNYLLHSAGIRRN